LAGTALLTSCDQFNDLLVSLGLRDEDSDDPAPFYTEPEPEPKPEPESEGLTTLAEVQAALTADGEHVDLVIGEPQDFTWEALLDAIDAAGKTVVLDISQTTLALSWNNDGAAVFDPRKSDGEPYNTGEPYITTLTLPNRPKLPGKPLEIAEGTSSGGVRGIFAGFTGLKEVYANEVKTINHFAFSNIKTLEKAFFLVLENIGMQAFEDCPALTDLYLPAKPPTLLIQGNQTASLFQSPLESNKAGTLTIHVPTGADYSAWEGEKDNVYGRYHKTVVFDKK
jgi:hypothetical protein